MQRDGRGRGQHHARRRPAVEDAIERDRLPGAYPSGVGRCRARAGLAPARSRHLRRRRSGPVRRGGDARRDRRVGRHAGAGSGGRPAASALSFAKSLAVALDRPIVAVHHLAGHIESVFLEHGAIPLPAAILVVSADIRASTSCPSPASIASWDARATMRPARPTTRWRGCSASVIQEAPSWIGARRTATTRPWCCHVLNSPTRIATRPGRWLTARIWRSSVSRD